LKVFLVEDSPLLRSRLEAMLSSIPGASVVGHAESADEAIDGIRATAPDAVVLDLGLRSGNGFDVLRAAAAPSPQIAFYVLTNHPIDAFRAAAQRLGARGFFDKSTEFEALKAALAGLAR
jgi:DNA-binding NarL/FixJ family response regulator